MSSVSASKSALLLSPCLRWAWEGAPPYDDRFSDTTKRDRGTLFHTLIECLINGWVFPENNKPYFPEMLAWANKAYDWFVQHLKPRATNPSVDEYDYLGLRYKNPLFTEVYVAYNFSTGVVHLDPGVRDRKYPKLPGLIPGTADLAGLVDSGRLYVADWKTGGATGADKQLMTLACGLRKAWGTSGGAILAILYVGEDGVHPAEWEVTDADLDAHERDMAMQLQDVGIRKDAVVGIHCTQLYCPHLAHCTGITTHMDDMAEGEAGLLPASALTRKYAVTDKPTSDEHAGHIMARIYAAKRQYEYLQNAIRKYVDDGGRAIAGDFEYKKTNQGYKWVKRG